MRKLCLLFLFAGFIACTTSHDTTGSHELAEQELSYCYASGMTALKQGDSCMAYWHWSLVQNQMDKRFEDTIRKYGLKTCKFTQ